MKTLSIRAHLLILVLAMSIPLVAVIGIGIHDDMQAAIANTKASLRTLAATIARTTGHKIAGNRQILEGLATRALVKRVDPRHCDGILADLLPLNPDFADVGYTNMAGVVVCSAVPQPGGKQVMVGESPWFRKFVSTGRFTVGDPFFGPITGKWVSVLSAPILGEDRKMVGGVQLPIALKAYDPEIDSQYLPAGSRYGLLSGERYMIWRNVDAEGLIGTRVDQIEAARRAIEVGDGDFESVGSDGVARFYSVVPVPEASWFAIVGVPSQAVYAVPRQHALNAAILAVAAISLLVLLALLIARRLAGPILALARTADAVRDGNLGARAPVSGAREVVRVATAFNAMSEEIAASRSRLEAESSAHRQTAEALRASEEWFRSIFENTNTGIASTDSAGNITGFNEAFRAMLGYDAETLGRMNFADFTHPADLAIESVYFDEILKQQREHYRIEKRYIAGDGHIIWIDLSTAAIRHANGEVKNFVGVITDITERKRIEDALHASTERLKEAQRIGHLGAWELNVVSNKLEWSDEVFRIFEIDPSQFGASYEAFIGAVHPDDRNRVHRAYTDSLEARAPYEIAHRVLTKDGRIKWVHERCVSEFDASGRPLRSRGMAQDISASKQAEAELEQLNQELERRIADRTHALLIAKDAAEAANVAKSTFLSSMSHELRTPLNSVLGYAQLFAMDQQVSQDTRDNAHQIEKAGRHLLALVDDILDLARIESGRMETHIEAVALAEVLGDCRKIIEPQAQLRGIVLEMQPISVGLLADRTRLSQVLLNLLSNAVKYNRDGGRVAVHGAEQPAVRYRISVTDSGPGIPTERIGELFQAFNRLGAEMGTIEGTGIGLVITKTLVESMDGRIGVESQVGTGTTFWVELPLA
jgi:PAS domain S-box-containing protein